MNMPGDVGCARASGAGHFRAWPLLHDGSDEFAGRRRGRHSDASAPGALAAEAVIEAVAFCAKHRADVARQARWNPRAGAVANCAVQRDGAKAWPAGAALPAIKIYFNRFCGR